MTLEYFDDWPKRENRFEPDDYTSSQTELVGKDQLKNPEWLKGLRATCYAMHIPDYQWLDFVTDLHRDCRSIFVCEGAPLSLNMEVFEFPSVREWFRDFCCTPCPPHVTPRVRGRAIPRVIVLATIIKATLPDVAKTWGAAANDNSCPGADFLSEE